MPYTRKLYLLLIIMTSLLFVNCTSSKIDCSSNASYIKIDNFECTRISDCEWHITSTETFNYIHVYGIKGDFINEMNFVSDNTKLYMQINYDHYYKSLKKTNKIIIQSSRKITFDKLNVFMNKENASLFLTFSNFSLGFYSDSYLMEK